MDILALIKAEISAIIRSEMKATLAEDLTFIKVELQAVRAKVANSAMAFRAEIGQVRLCQRY